MTEPLTARAGDTWTWLRTFSDYPAPTWVLTYYLRNQSATVNITATAENTGHRVTVTAAQSAVFEPGRYDWIARVADGTSVYTVAEGSIEVLRNLATVGAQDGRTHARKVLDAIEAVLEDRATHDQASYSIGGRSLSRTPVTELLVLRDKYKSEVRSEERAERIKRGLGVGKIKVRF